MNDRRWLHIVIILLAAVLIGGVLVYGLSMTKSSVSTVTTVVTETTTAETTLPVYTTIPAEVAQTVYTTAPPETTETPKATDTPLQTAEASDTPSTAAPETAPTVSSGPRTCVGTATLTAVGNILPAAPLVSAAMVEQSIYDFSPFLQYLKTYISRADFAVATLETVLGGVKSDGYTGAPLYNSPDALAEGLRDTGFDALVTATNHAYDGDNSGFHRTVQTVRSCDMYALGTVDLETEQNFLIKEINGIKIGMVAFTYETDDQYVDTTSLNGILMTKANTPLVNSYSPNEQEAFLEKMQTFQSTMTEAGADVTVLFIHWGDQYSFTPTQHQQNLAQRLCDMGVDVIVGTHPHVVQQPTLLSSRIDTRDKTLVLYSLGNAMSNQRKGYIRKVPTAHTEDGLLAAMTFKKYSDGKTYLEGFQAVPLWINLHSSTKPLTYTILPLEAARRGNWTVDYDLSDASFQRAKDSAERTQTLLGTSVTDIAEKLQTAANSRSEPEPEPEEQKK